LNLCEADWNEILIAERSGGDEEVIKTGIHQSNVPDIEGVVTHAIPFALMVKFRISAQ
jgi:hypothetical protein